MREKARFREKRCSVGASRSDGIFRDAPVWLPFFGKAMEFI